MIINRRLVIQLTKMKEKERNLFLHTKRSEIIFFHLKSMLKKMTEEAIEKTETDLAQKFLDIKSDIVLYEAGERFPGAVCDITMVSGNPGVDSSAEMVM